MAECEEYLCGGCLETFENLDDRKLHRIEAHPDECSPIRFCFCAFCGKQLHSVLAAYDHILEAHSAQWSEMVSRMFKVSRLKDRHFQERWALAGSACVDTPRKATLKSVLKSIDDFWTFPVDKENNEPSTALCEQADPVVEEVDETCPANADDLQEIHTRSTTTLLCECSNTKKDDQSPALPSTASPLIEPSSSEISDEEEQVPSTSADQPREETEPVQFACVITRADNIVEASTRKRVASDVPSSHNQGPSTSVLEGILKKPRTDPPTSASLPQQMIHAALTSDGVTMPVLIPKDMICFHDNGTPYIDMAKQQQNDGPRKYAFLPEESLRKEQRQVGPSALQQQQASSHSSSTFEPSQQPIRINVGSSEIPSTSSGPAPVSSSHQHLEHPSASRTVSTNASTLQSLLEASFAQQPLNEDMPMSSKATTSLPTSQAESSLVYDVSQADPDYVFWTGKDTTGRCPRCSYSTAGGPQTKRGHFVKCHYNIYYDKVKRAESELETFMFIKLGHELPNRPRKCLYCSLSSSNYTDRKALLEHHYISHPTEFLAFRARFEQLRLKTGEFVDRAILEVIQASHLIQT